MQAQPAEHLPLTGGNGRLVGPGKTNEVNAVRASVVNENQVDLQTSNVVVFKNIFYTPTFQVVAYLI